MPDLLLLPILPMTCIVNMWQQVHVSIYQHLSLSFLGSVRQCHQLYFSIAITPVPFEQGECQACAPFSAEEESRCRHEARLIREMDDKSPEDAQAMRGPAGVARDLPQEEEAFINPRHPSIPPALAAAVGIRQAAGAAHEVCQAYFFNLCRHMSFAAYHSAWLTHKVKPVKHKHQMDWQIYG